MLDRVTSLDNTKNWKEAILFLILHLALAAAILFLVVYIFSDYAQFAPGGLELSRIVAAVAVILYSVGLNCVLLVKKKLYKNFWYMLFVILSPTLAIWGLALAAFLTTRNVELSSNVGPESHSIIL